MKILYSVILLFFAMNLKSQVVVDSTDMAVPGDILKFRTANNLSGLNYQQTDTAFVWDFSSLSATSETIDTFVNVNSTNLAYLAVYANPLDQTNKATVAQPMKMQAIPMISITESFNFYKNNYYRFTMLGMGTKVNNIPVPLKFDHPDVLYHFPVTFGTQDTSDSEVHANIPGLGYYGHTVHRENHVDGWGTLYLPADTFEVIRVKSKVIYYDTIYYDSIGFGGGSTRNVTEYKWLTDGFHEPVLQITKSGQNNISAKYFNHIPIDLSVESIDRIRLLDIYPNPAIDFITIEFPNPSDVICMTVTDITGRVLAKNNIQQQRIVLPLNQWQKGVYFVQVSDARNTYCGKFIKY